MTTAIAPLTAGKLSGNKVECCCEVCGACFVARRDKREKGQSRYCSRSCFMRQRNADHPLVGPSHPQWNGGKRHSQDGYLFVLIDGRYIQEHRVVMERYLGRPLRADEVVHHINGDKQDNRIENLQVLTNAEHMRVHGKQRGGLNG